MITVLTGNKAAAQGVLLSRPDVIAMQMDAWVARWWKWKANTLQSAC
jgi:hypothetical protein